MAEGDVIHRYARRMRASLVGQEISEATSPDPRAELRRASPKLVGATPTGVEARGKHLLIHFDNELSIHSHMGMNGSWHLYPVTAGRRPRWRKPRNRAWLHLRTEPLDAVQFGGPKLKIVRTVTLAIHPVLRRLGPDILDDGFTPEVGLAALRSIDQSRELGDALLDQSVICGIGNIYKSEGCFAAGVNPWAHLGEVTDDQLIDVCDLTERMMRYSLDTNRHEMKVYRRHRTPCRRCRSTTIRARRQGDDARTTYWCPVCQADPAGT